MIDCKKLSLKVKIDSSDEIEMVKIERKKAKKKIQSIILIKIIKDLSSGNLTQKIVETKIDRTGITNII